MRGLMRWKALGVMADDGFVECVGLFVGLCLVFGDEYLAPHA
jgi:hypothetical protein